MASNSPTLAWGFHVEAILVWCRMCSAHLQYEHVWVVEDDVGFSGDMGNFLADYADSDVDLLTHTVQHVSMPQEDAGGVDWFWTHVASDEFVKHVPSHLRLKGAEHVQRFSRRFLTALDQLSSQGITAWSEQAVPSLCAFLGMTRSPLEDRHIGTPFDWQGRHFHLSTCNRCGCRGGFMTPLLLQGECRGMDSSLRRTRGSRE